MYGSVFFSLAFFGIIALADPVKIGVDSVNHDVQVYYQTTYLAADQVCRISPQVLNQRDKWTGQTFHQILAADKNGIPTLSHTWIEARRKIRFTWNGKEHTANESEVISWLPHGQPIKAEALRQPGMNYDLAGTERALNMALATPVDELLTASHRTRIEGPAIGWAQASRQAPIIRRPLLGAIPRRIAGRRIEQEVDSTADTLYSIALRPRLVYERGRFEPVSVNEDTFMAIRARTRRTEGFAYSMYLGVERKNLEDRFGTTNCFSFATDLLAGGTSRHGEVGYVNYGVARGFTASSLTYHHYAAHGPTYRMKKSVRERENVDERSIAARVDGKKDVGACKCEAVKSSCRLTLAAGSRYELAQECKSACAPGGGLMPLILANCTELTITAE